MKFRHLQTSYQIDNYLIECNEEKWMKVLKIMKDNDNIEDILTEVKNKQLGTIYTIKELE